MLLTSEIIDKIHELSKQIIYIHSLPPIDRVDGHHELLASLRRSRALLYEELKRVKQGEIGCSV